MSQKAGYVREIRLFGSRARGDDSASSDLDVLCVVDTARTSNNGQMDSDITHFFGSGTSDVSRYSERRLREMFDTGHLFAWHLYLESKPVWSDSRGSFVESLGRPARYAHARKDIVELAEIALEALESLRDSTSSIVYECGILYVCSRNVALIASTRLCSAPNFSPQSPMQVHVPRIPYPLSHDEYELLIAARHSVTRGTAIPALSRERATEIGERAERWIRSVVVWTLEKCNEALV